VTDHSPAHATRRRHPSEVSVVAQHFAHPSEELFARLLTLYGVDWLYEPVEFPLAWRGAEVSRAFRPDFYVPSRRLFIELTVAEQRLVTRKNRKVREFRTLYPELDIVVVYRRDFEALMREHHLSVDFAAA
jgi:hypoxanthine phosphoribosyltransferase